MTPPTAAEVEAVIARLEENEKPEVWTVGAAGAQCVMTNPQLGRVFVKIRDAAAMLRRLAALTVPPPRAKPTIAELEEIINSDDDLPIQILPDGSIAAAPQHPPAPDTITSALTGLIYERQHGAPAPLSVPSDDVVECPGCGYVVAKGKMLATHTMLMDMAKMREELERLRPDAERYRFIREGRKGTYNKILIYTDGTLDAAIDAALREPAQSRPGEERK